ncbi:MAG: ParB/RepB/Spo0J family partition protein [Candidatus Paceibacterota bacterium]
MANQKGKGIESLIPKKQFPNKSLNNNQDHSSNSFQKNDSLPKIEDKVTSNKKIEKSRSDDQVSSKESVFQIEVDKINPNPYQPRKEYNEDDLKDLASSIREVGIIQPLVATKVEEESESGTRVEYQLISGERRLRASKLLGMKTVPVIVRRSSGNRDKLSMALIENIQRADLNPVETARAYSRLQDEFGLTQREIATKVGKNRTTVANTIRLLNLPSDIQRALSEGKINESQARNLLSITDQEEQERVFQLILDKKITGRDFKNIKKKGKENDSDNQDNKSSRENRFWEKQLEEKLSVPVKIMKKGNKGKLVIKFFSQDDWKKIVDKFFSE